jgi:transposase
MPKKPQKKESPLSKKFQKLHDDLESIQNMTNKEIYEKYKISAKHFNRFKRKFGIDNIRKETVKPDQTQERLKRIENVDTSKLTQRELQSLLGFSSRSAVSYFCKKNNIPFTKKRNLDG